MGTSYYVDISGERKKIARVTSKGTGRGKRIEFIIPMRMASFEDIWKTITKGINCEIINEYGKVLTFEEFWEMVEEINSDK